MRRLLIIAILAIGAAAAVFGAWYRQRGARPAVLPGASQAPAPSGTPIVQRYRIGALPRDFPQELIPSGIVARDLSAIAITYPDRSLQESVSFTGNMPPKALFQLYSRTLPGRGWRIVSQNAVSGVLTARKPGESVHIIVEEFGGTSIVNIALFFAPK